MTNPITIPAPFVSYLKVSRYEPNAEVEPIYAAPRYYGSTYYDSTSEKRMTILKRYIEIILARQKFYDTALLNTYHTKTDLMIALKKKYETFKSKIQIMEGNLTQLKQRLEAKQNDAETINRNSAKVPVKLQNDIKSAQKLIQEQQNAISAQKEKQELTRKADQSDIARFLFLSKSLSNDWGRHAKIIEANELGLYYCQNDFNCNYAWKIGHEFVNYYSTTPKNVFNEELIMSRPPVTDTEISLSLSRIPLNEQDSQLFLDIQCRESSAGEALCASQKIKDIRTAFSHFVNDTLSERLNRISRFHLLIRQPDR
jgi:hypothetical protein